MGKAEEIVKKHFKRQEKKKKAEEKYKPMTPEERRDRATREWAAKALMWF